MIRTLTLQEWFLAYQLEYIEKNYSHISGFWEVDLTRLIAHFDGEPEKIPLTSLLIKAGAIWQRECPVVNRQMFRTPWGRRFYCCESRAVNVPAVLNAGGEPYLSVVSIKKADEKTLAEIHQELHDFARTDPSSLPIGRFLAGKRNHLLNRLRLALIHRLVNRLPILSERMEAGTISVSSILSTKQKQADVTFMGKGPGAMSLTICGMDTSAGKLKIGFSWDHATSNGHEAVAASKTFCMMLQGDLPDLFNELVS